MSRLAKIIRSRKRNRKRFEEFRKQFLSSESVKVYSFNCVIPLEVYKEDMTIGELLRDSRVRILPRT